jgi:hypothetical protein
MCTKLLQTLLLCYSPELVTSLLPVFAVAIMQPPAPGMHMHSAARLLLGGVPLLPGHSAVVAAAV